MTNLKKIEAFFAAYAQKNVAAIRDVMADDITWFIPGHHPLSGTKKGIPEVLSFFDQLARADQHKADAFFWSIYQLKPIPDRLA